MVSGNEAAAISRLKRTRMIYLKVDIVGGVSFFKI